MHVIYNCSNAADKLTLYQNAFALRILSNSLLNPLSLADLMFLLDWKWGGFYSYQFKLAPLLKASIELNQTALDSFEHVLSSQISKYIFKGEKTDTDAYFFCIPKHSLVCVLLPHLFPPKIRLKSINRIKITINWIKSLSLGSNRIRNFLIQYFKRPTKQYQ